MLSSRTFNDHDFVSVMTNILPIFDIVQSYYVLTVSDLMNIGMTCKAMSKIAMTPRRINAVGELNLYKLIPSFKIPTKELLYHISQLNGIISGSFALQCVSGTNKYFHDYDIDIYIPYNSNTSNIRKFLLSYQYDVHENTLAGLYKDIVFDMSISTYHDYTCTTDSGEKKIQLIFMKENYTPSQATDLFDINICRVMITPTINTSTTSTNNNTMTAITSSSVPIQQKNNNIYQSTYPMCDRSDVNIHVDVKCIADVCHRRISLNSSFLLAYKMYYGLSKNPMFPLYTWHFQRRNRNTEKRILKYVSRGFHFEHFLQLPVVDSTDNKLVMFPPTIPKTCLHYMLQVKPPLLEEILIKRVQNYPEDLFINKDKCKGNDDENDCGYPLHVACQYFCGYISLIKLMIELNPESKKLINNDNKLPVQLLPSVEHFVSTGVEQSSVEELLELAKELEDLRMLLH